ncbi:hypothetical protein [Sphingobium lignivorans]|uniref:Uncharacterized protein n=1 Tax=Sphingobium lignivorans TaxID=2735886 RepID=A0ABR6NBD1_9SPHN|nr:hypothetical protein [Sphingobium lignivorans]MBB5984366.1 hypothetical protein [Sphingobium lignivorans]
MMLAIFLAAQAVATEHCEKRPLGWGCQSQWVAELPHDEQRVVLQLLHGGLKIEFRTVAENAKSKADFCWATAIAGYGEAMLMMGATKNPDVRRYLSYNSEVFRRAANRSISLSEANTLIAAQPNPFEMSPVTPSIAEEIGNKYKHQYKAAEDALIAFSKVAASRTPECQSIIE